MITQKTMGAPTCLNNNTPLRLNDPKRRIVKRVTAAFIRDNRPRWWTQSPHANATENRLSRDDIFERDGYKCAYCELDLRDSRTQSTLDHILPKCVFDSKPEANHDENLVTCCLKCNRLKKDWFPQHPTDVAWYTRAGFIRAARLQINHLGARISWRKQWCSPGQYNTQKLLISS
jgi:5-methylcytosine-specific restriction endonuclease McrA